MIIVRPVEITDTNLTSTNIPENDEPVYNSGTTYNLDDVVMVTTGVHRRYRALKTTTNEYPPDNTTGSTPAWLDLGATNAWKMFDGVTSTYTENASGTISVDIDSSQVINAVTLFGLQGSSVVVTMTDPLEGVVYNKTIPLVDNFSVTSWYAYYFEPISAKYDLSLLDLPSYANATLSVTVQGSSTKIGLLLIGNQTELGKTDYGTSVGITDYSIKQTDDFGNFYVQQRRYSNIKDYAVTVRTDQVAFVTKTLAQYRATPLVWIGTPDNEATIVYGYYRDFNIIISGFEVSDCSIEVEGL